MPGVLVGLCSGAVTPWLAARFGVAARWWVWVPAGLAAGAVLGWRGAGPVWLVVLAVGVPLTAIDLGVHRLPDALVLPAVAAASLATASPRALVAGAMLLLGYAALALLPRSGLGFGDVKLAGLLGIALGTLGWGAVTRGTVLAFTLGGVAALVLLATGRARRDTELPFGPSMLLAALVIAVS